MSHPTRLGRHALDSPRAGGLDDVFRLYVCRRDVAHPGSYGEPARMDPRHLRHICRIGVYSKLKRLRHGLTWTSGTAGGTPGADGAE